MRDREREEKITLLIHPHQFPLMQNLCLMTFPILLQCITLLHTQSMFCASSSHFLKIKVPSHEWICKNIYGIRIDKMIVYLFIFMFHSRHIYLHLMYKTKIYLIYRFLYKIFQKIALKSLLIISFYCAFIMYPAGNLC